MKNLILKYSIYLMLITLLTACSDKYKVDDYNKYPKPDTIFLGMTEATNDPLYVELVAPQTKKVDLSVSLEGETQKDITVSLIVDEEAIDKYNSDNSTSYEIIPSEAYSLSRTEVVVARGDTISNNATLTLNSLAMPDNEEEYILPIRITGSIGNSIAEINQENDIQYIIFKRKVPAPVFAIADTDQVTDILLRESQSEEVNIGVVAKVTSTRDVEISFKANADAVATYNSKNGTSYELLPSSAYTIENINIAKENSQPNIATLKLSSENLPDEKQYILPLTIGEITGREGAEIDPENSTRYILFKKVVNAELVDRSDWSIVYCSSVMNGWENAAGDPPSGPIECIIDGNIGTYWNYLASKQVPIDIIIDMGKETIVSGGKLTARRYSPTTDPNSPPRNPPCDIDVAFANNIVGNGTTSETTWYGKESFGTDVLLHQVENTFSLNTLQRARYIKLTVKKAWNSGSSVRPIPASYRGGTFAEYETLGQ